MDGQQGKGMDQIQLTPTIATRGRFCAIFATPARVSEFCGQRKRVCLGMRSSNGWALMTLMRWPSRRSGRILATKPIARAKDFVMRMVTLDTILGAAIAGGGGQSMDSIHVRITRDRYSSILSNGYTVRPTASNTGTLCIKRLWLSPDR